MTDNTEMPDRIHVFKSVVKDPFTKAMGWKLNVSALGHGGPDDDLYHHDRIVQELANSLKDAKDAYIAMRCNYEHITLRAALNDEHVLKWRAAIERSETK